MTGPYREGSGTPPSKAAEAPVLPFSRRGPCPHCGATSLIDVVWRRMSSGAPPDVLLTRQRVQCRECHGDWYMEPHWLTSASKDATFPWVVVAISLAVSTAVGMAMTFAGLDSDTFADNLGTGATYAVGLAAGWLFWGRRRR